MRPDLSSGWPPLLDLCDRLSELGDVPVVLDCDLPLRPLHDEGRGASRIVGLCRLCNLVEGLLDRVAAPRIVKLAHVHVRGVSDIFDEPVGQPSRALTTLIPKKNLRKFTGAALLSGCNHGKRASLGIVIDINADEPEGLQLQLRLAGLDELRHHGRHRAGRGITTERALQVHILHDRHGRIGRSDLETGLGDVLEERRRVVNAGEIRAR